jgi:hypothetical protein
MTSFILRLIPNEYLNDPNILELIDKHNSGEFSIYKLERRIFQYLKSKEMVQRPVFERTNLLNKQLISVKELEEGLVYLFNFAFVCSSTRAYFGIEEI